MRPKRAAAVAVGIAAIMALSAGCTGERVSAEGTWGTGSEGKPQLVLDAGGALSGTDGCNRLFGTWEQSDDQTVSFGDLGSTLMACPDVDTWLAGLSSGVLDGGIMHIQDSAGTEIGNLARVPHPE